MAETPRLTLIKRVYLKLRHFTSFLDFVAIEINNSIEKKSLKLNSIKSTYAKQKYSNKYLVVLVYLLLGLSDCLFLELIVARDNGISASSGITSTYVR